MTLLTGYKRYVMKHGSLKFVAYTFFSRGLEIFGNGVWVAVSHIIWCKCPKKHCCDLTMSWPITDVAKGARTIGEIQQISKLSKSSKHRYNCCHEPIFPFIPMHRVVIDSLHLFLRIADVLYKLLIRDLQILDGIDSNRA